MNKEEFFALNAAGRLPSPKGVAVQLLRLLQSESVSTQEIAKTIKSDPALSGRIVAAANASVNHGHRPVVSVVDALSVVGTAAACRFAVGLSIISGNKAGACKDFDYQRYWVHSLLIALTMQALAKRTRIGAGEEVFTVGLLSRIGQLALATLYPENYGLVLAQVTDAYAVVAAERAAFATDRVELGQYLLRDWGFPETLLAAIAPLDQDPTLHDAAIAPRALLLTRALRLSSRVADCGMRGALEALAEDDVVALGAPIGISSEDIAALWREVAAAWPTWGSIFELVSKPETLSASGPKRSSTAEPVAAHRAASVVQRLHAPPTEIPEAALSVLAVTGDPAVRRMLSALLDDGNVELRFADNDDDAIRAAVAGLPQLIVHDWLSASGHGLRLCRTLRGSAVGRAAYILVLSQMSGDAAVVQALEAGADDFLSRPIHADVLGAHLRVARRMLSLQNEIARDREEIRRYANELSLANRRLQELAQSDPLTGLGNRRFAMDRVESEWQMAVQNKQPLSCLMIDIDNFKRVNDCFGHDIGDRVLTRVAELLRLNARTVDTVCRVGGEEFLVVCRDTDRAAALLCGERLRRVIGETKIEVDGHPHRVTVSVGVAAVTSEVNDPPALLKHADQALYRAKEHGRNRVNAA